MVFVSWGAIIYNLSDSIQDVHIATKYMSDQSSNHKELMFMNSPLGNGAILCIETWTCAFNNPDKTHELSNSLCLLMSKQRP